MCSLSIHPAPGARLEKPTDFDYRPTRSGRANEFPEMIRHHVIISGTGRTGTTFLVQLLTAAGLDTGFTDVASAVSPHCNAGMERDIRQPDAPYVVKSPWLCDHLDEVLNDRNIHIDHAIIPIRDLFSAAESRREVARKATAARRRKKVSGGLWHTELPEEQEAVLANQLYKLLFALAKRNIPVTLLHYPRLVQEPEYLYRKLGFLMSGFSYGKFLSVFNQVVRPDLVHDYVPAPKNTTRAGWRAATMSYLCSLILGLVSKITDS